MDFKLALSSGVLYPYLFDLIITIEPVLITHDGGKVKGPTIMPVNFYNSLKAKMDDKFETLEDYHKTIDTNSFYTRVHPEIKQRFKEFEKVQDMEGKITMKMEQRQNLICYLTLNPGAQWLLNGLSFIKAPVVNILGGVSKWCPKENEETMNRRIPIYERDVIVGGDHLVNIEMPAETLAKVIAHITIFVDKSKRVLLHDISTNQRRTKFQQDFEASFYKGKSETYQLTTFQTLEKYLFLYNLYFNNIHSSYN